MALDFPSNPTIGQQYSGPNNIVYEWDGVKWKSANGVSPERIIEGDTLAQVTESGTTGTFEVRVDNKQRLRIIDSGNVYSASGTTALLGVGADAGSVVNLNMGDGIYSSYSTLQLTSSAETRINLGDNNSATQLSILYTHFNDAFTISSAGTAFLTRYQGNTEINKLVANVDNSTQTDPIAVFKDTGTEVARFDNGGNLGIGEANPQSQITVVKTLDGGRGAELSLVNYGNTRGGPPQVGTETAINFGLDYSSYWGDDGNAQIRARICDPSNAGTQLSIYNWNGSTFGERLRVQQSIANNNVNGVLVARDLTIYGNTGGNYGNRLLIGTDTATYSVQDTNVRPTIYMSGQYPKICLNHTLTGNTNHGPTLQFTCNGVGNQFVIGTGGSGNMLTMGYSSAADWNEHNGISGYNGISFFGAQASNGYVGIGAQGDWGPPGGTGANAVPYPVSFLSYNNAVNGHAFWFDNQINAANNGSGALFRNLFSNHSWGITAEFRVEANGGADRASILFSNGYNSNTWSVGFGYADDHFRIKKDHGHRNGGWGTDMMRFDRGNNNAYFIANVYQNQSDLRLKTNLSTIDNPLEKLRQISGYYFNWNEKTKDFNLNKNLEEREVGVVAQEIEKIMPEAVSVALFDMDSDGDSKTGEGYLTVRYDALIPLLIEAVKAQQVQIEELKQLLAS